MRTARASHRPRPESTTSSRLGWIAAAIAIVVAVAAAYAPAYRAGFVWDDDDYVELNPTLSQPGGLGHIWNPGSPLNPQWYPLVFTTFRIERALWGLDPTGYHVVNVALHALNALILLALLRRLGVSAAWLAAALFALHPVMVETVAWVTERKNLLSTLFSLLAALAFLRYEDERKTRWLAATFAAFVLALLGKTVAASLPVALFLLSWWRERSLDGRQWAALGAMAVVGVAAGMITKAHEAEHVLAGLSVGLEPATRVLGSGRIFLFYPWKLAWPASLAFVYPRWDPGDVAAGLACLAVVVLLAAGLYATAKRGLGRGPFAALAIYAVTIFPALGFVDVAPLRFSWVADHFQYQASIAWIALAVGGIAWALERAPRAAQVGAAAAGVLAVAWLAALSHEQSKIYRDRGTLWRDTATKNPNSWMVQNNLGQWLLEHEHDAAGAQSCFETVLRLSPPPSEAAVNAFTNLAVAKLQRDRAAEAVEDARRALALHPGHPLAQLTLGRALAKSGKLAEAEAVLRALLDDVPNPAAGRAAWDIRRRVSDADVWIALGNAQDAGGRFADAAESFRRAAAVDPNRSEAPFDLGNELLKLGKLDEADAAYRRALELQPAYAKAHLNRIKALATAKRYEDAVAAARRAVALVPRDPLLASELAWLLVTSPDPAPRSAAEAATWLEHARAEETTPSPRALEAFAAMQAESGRFAEAAEAARRALAAVPPETPTAARMRAEIEAYDRSQPWREPR